ncbi:MAG: chemotaxis response regulator protein-glutamate methylesterase [Rickettsiales bacterium]|nr:chemotaxis response regulator protein-glutamate methylesterase [Rickettsiales bacterium]
MNKKIKVLIVDDSALVREMFAKFLESDPGIVVGGTAVDPIDARSQIKKINPDVITLDIEMPKMDGISFLEKIMSLRPMPVLMVSSLTTKGAAVSLKALEMGAVDYIPKPLAMHNKDVMKMLKKELIAKVKSAAESKPRFVKMRGAVRKGKDIDSKTSKKDLLLPFTPNEKAAKRLIAIGASTGGVEAIREILSVLPKNTPPIVITQHMPPQFTSTFADRLNGICEIQVQEAQDQMKLEPGNAYIAPGDTHLTVVKRGDNYHAEVKADGEKISGHKPSVDALFHSVALHANLKAIGVLLTGMGSDGAEGLLAIKRNNGITYAQNEATCVVYGMPKAAKKLDAVDHEMSLEKMAKDILNSCNN